MLLWLFVYLKCDANLQVFNPPSYTRFEFLKFLFHIIDTRSNGTFKNATRWSIHTSWGYYGSILLSLSRTKNVITFDAVVPCSCCWSWKFSIVKLNNQINRKQICTNAAEKLQTNLYIQTLKIQKLTKY